MVKKYRAQVEAEFIGAWQISCGGGVTNSSMVTWREIIT